MATKTQRRPQSNAYEDGLRTLYKFMRYPRDGDTPSYDQKRRSWVETFLQSGEIYMPTAEMFNDPFEASPHLKLPEGSPEEQFQVYAKDLRENHAHQLGWGEKEIARWEATTRTQFESGQFAQQLELIELKWRPFFRSECPTLCFAGNRNSTLMWSYYADGHTGVCIHLDATKAPIGNAQRVEYDSDYPTISGPLGNIDAEIMVTKALCWKSDVWKHEEEYRLINLPRDARPGNPGVLDAVLRRIDKHRVQLPAHFVTGVTIGAAMRHNEIESILRACHDRRPQIPVYQSKLRRGSFSLEFAAIV